ncbi:MAG: DUF1990 domain-containing protein [Acidobacteriota bacterium]|nr:DUF1990 domain-containing protein [Acidobacteriota bacterium]
MFLLHKPSEEVVRQFITSQRDLSFTYNEVGATRTQPPAGYNVDHNRIRLGDGEETYMRAVAALRAWKHFNLGWAGIVPPGLPVEAGTTVAVEAKTFGFWSLNACRIVYVIDENEPVRKSGFAYGTLRDHVECGEERFTIEWHKDDSVWYDIYAFSRPHHPIVRLSVPLARMLQKRFARDSLAAMVIASKA